MTQEEIIKKYTRYRDNVRWHIETNKPIGQDLIDCTNKWTAYQEVVKDLESVPAPPASGGMKCYRVTKVEGGQPFPFENGHYTYSVTEGGRITTKAMVKGSHWPKDRFIHIPIDETPPASEQAQEQDAIDLLRQIVEGNEVNFSYAKESITEFLRKYEK